MAVHHPAVQCSGRCIGSAKAGCQHTCRVLVKPKLSILQYDTIQYDLYDNLTYRNAGYFRSIRTANYSPYAPQFPMCKQRGATDKVAIDIQTSALAESVPWPAPFPTLHYHRLIILVPFSSSEGTLRGRSRCGSWNVPHSLKVICTASLSCAALTFFIRETSVSR